MFDFYCIIIAALLYGNATKTYKPLALAVFAEFILHDIAHNYLFLDFRADNKWFIYYIYASIQLPIMIMLYKLKSHFVISGLILINLAYNLIVPLSYFDADYLFIYEAKTAVIQTIMVMELTYLGLLTRYARSFIEKRWGVNADYIDRVFRVGSWARRTNRGLA